jgi:hypothetical protein
VLCNVMEMGKYLSIGQCYLLSKELCLVLLKEHVMFCNKFPNVLFHLPLVRPVNPAFYRESTQCKSRIGIRSRRKQDVLP